MVVIIDHLRGGPKSAPVRRVGGNTSVVPGPRVHALVREALMDANDDIPPVLHIWWQANTLYPDLAASERLGLAEEALRQILDDELVVLIRNRAYPTNMGEVVPPDECDSVLRR